jgi:hypothetical protein
VTVVTMLVWLFFLAARLRVHYAPGIRCALCFEGGTFPAYLAPKTRGEIAKPWRQTRLL